MIAWISERLLIVSAVLREPAGRGASGGRGQPEGQEADVLVPRLRLHYIAEPRQVFEM